MIESECHSDDHAVKVNFDATPYFEQASDKDLLDLAVCGFGGDYAADYVAQFLADGNDEIAFMFKYVEVRHKIDDCGFECHINEEQALAWIAKHRRQLFDQMLILFEST